MRFLFNFIFHKVILAYYSLVPTVHYGMGMSTGYSTVSEIYMAIMASEYPNLSAILSAPDQTEAFSNYLVNPAVFADAAGLPAELSAMHKMVMNRASTSRLFRYCLLVTAAFKCNNSNVNLE